MKTIAPAALISVIVTCAIAGLIALDSSSQGASAGDIVPVGTACDTPPFKCEPPTSQPVDGGMDAMSIDMDPSAAPANTATSIGSREFCARINENDLLDADEEEIDTIEFDMTTGPEGIPEEHPMLGYSFQLRYPAPDFRIVANDVKMLVATASGSQPFNVSDQLPDVDGTLNASVVDLNVTASESGPGVLARIQLETTSSVGSGVNQLVLQGAAHIDPDNHPFPPHALNHAIVVVDDDCPAEQPEPSLRPGLPMTPPPTFPPSPSPDDARMDAMSIDMDPSSDPANSATSIGSREFCARANENDLLDADEVAIDTLEFDLTAGPEGIPAVSKMIGFQVGILYDATAVRVVEEHADYLLVSGAGSSLFSDLSDAVPDDDGNFGMLAIDHSNGPDARESGPGSLPGCALRLARMRELAFIT